MMSSDSEGDLAARVPVPVPPREGALAVPFAGEKTLVGRGAWWSPIPVGWWQGVNVELPVGYAFETSWVGAVPVRRVLVMAREERKAGNLFGGTIFVGRFSDLFG